MQLTAKEAWKRILENAREQIPDHAIRTWLEPTEAVALDDNQLIVGAPDQFAVEWNETKHATLLSNLAQSVLGAGAAVVFRVHEEQQQRPQMDFFVAPPSGREVPLQSDASKSAKPLNERYTFNAFVIGKLPHSAS